MFREASETMGRLGFRQSLEHIWWCKELAIEERYYFFRKTKVCAVSRGQLRPIIFQPTRLTVSSVICATPIKPRTRPCGAGRTSCRSKPCLTMSSFMPVSEKKTVCQGGQKN